MTDPRLSRLCLTLALAPLSAFAQPAPAPSGEPVQQLDALVVTGTNLRAGEAAASAVNLRIVTAAEAEQRGIDNVTALLRKIPEVGANGFAENRVNTSSPGTAAISLRGLGVNSTLVLLNGRRLTPAPFGQGGSAAGLGTESFVDLNMIPVSALARVEVLKDGASAIYGADAVAGVVNLILKDRIEGVTVTAGYGDFSGGITAPTLRGSIVAGGSAGATRATVIAEFLDRDEFLYGELALKAVLSLASNNPGTFVVPVGATNPITGDVIPAGTAAGGRTFTPSRTGPGFTTETTATNRFDANAAIRPQPATRRTGLLANVRHEFSDTLEVFLELGYQRNRNTEGLSAAPISALNSITLPANAVFNPFGVAVVNGGTAGQTMFYRFTELGDRLTFTTNESHRVVGGLTGEVFGTWTWEAAATYQRSTSHNDLQGFPSQDRVNAALATLNPAQALNLFTNGTTVRNSPAVLASLESGATRDAATRLTAFDAKTAGSLFDLPAGPVALAVGGQFRTETFSDERSPVQLLNQAVPPAPARGDRDVTAGYVEVGVPVTAPAQSLVGLHSLDLNLAGRIESFSDAGIGEDVVPKIGVRWQPFDPQVSLRASWGEGFRAPSLAELYLPQTVAISFNIVDPARFGRPGSTVNDGNTGQRQVRSGGNPLLAPEKSESHTAGILIQPKFVPGLSLSVDYYKVTVTDRIGQPATPAIILANPALFPGAIVRAAPTASDTANGLPGELLEIRTVLGNFGRAETSGFDFAAEYRFSAGSLGRFTARGAASVVDQQTLRTRPDLPELETAGTYEVPEWRGDASLTWTREQVGATLGVNYIGGFADTAPSTLQVKQQITTDVQVSYRLDRWNTTVALGVNNLFDEDPPRTAFSTAYAERVSNLLPRFVYTQVTTRF